MRKIHIQIESNVSQVQMFINKMNSETFNKSADVTFRDFVELKIGAEHTWMLGLNDSEQQNRR